MPENKNFGFLDLLVILVKWKKFFISFFIISMVICYLAIYFFVQEKYESSALILPSQQENTSGISGFLSNLKGLPIDLGGMGTGTDVDLYNSIVYSRTLLDKVINKFDLIKVYKMDTSAVDYKEQTLKELKSNINADLNNDGVTYSISVSAPSPELAAEMTNYIVSLLNKEIIDLKIQKSKDNRIFLENRVQEVKDSLAKAENMMKKFQERTGMFEAENQTKAILEQLATLQASLAEKQVEQSVYGKIYGENSSQALNAKITAKELADKLNNIKSGQDTTNTFLSLNKLPKKVVDYFRHFRDIEIYSNILEFELPLYEQAKFQEQKDVPILQVIDYAIPPAKRSFPKRTIMAFLITVVLMLIAFVFVLLKENENLQSSEKYQFVRNNLFKWKSKNQE